MQISKLELFKEKAEEYKHFKVLSYYIVILILYNVYEAITVPKYYMYTRLDDYIPFVRQMVIPYLLWYVYIIIALIYLGFKSKKDFLDFVVFMFSGMTICFVIYALFPNGQNLRPVITSNDIFSRIISSIYLTDTPTNSAPSMHTLNAIAVHVALVRYQGLQNKLWIKTGSFITMVLIIMSTVMIKQHSILDVLYGFLLSGGLYIVVYKLNIVDKLSDYNFSSHNKEKF